MSITDQYQKLLPNQVLDVSRIDPITGNNALISSTHHDNKKFGTNNLPIVSDNLANYIIGIQLLFGNLGIVTYINDILSVNQLISNNSLPKLRSLSSIVPQPQLSQPSYPSLQSLSSPRSPLQSLSSPRSPSLLPVSLSGPRSPSQDSLVRRYEKLQSGYVLDVSKMDANGKGALTIKRPNRSKKAGVPNIKIISSNLTNYIRALELLFGSNAQRTYANEINQVASFLEAQ